MKDQLGHHSIKLTVDVYGHLVPGANKAAVDWLDEQAQTLEAAMGQIEGAPAQAEGPGIARNPTQPPRNHEFPERTRGVTDRSVTLREKMVELRGLEPLTPRLPVWSGQQLLRATDMHKYVSTLTCRARQMR